MTHPLIEMIRTTTKTLTHTRTRTARTARRTVIMPVMSMIRTTKRTMTNTLMIMLTVKRTVTSTMTGSASLTKKTMPHPMIGMIRTTTETFTRSVRHNYTSTTATLADALRSLARGIRGLWASHEELMDSSDLYRALVIATTAALARQVSLHRLVLAIISALMNTWAAARDRGPWHDRNPQRYDPDGEDGWSYA